MKKLTSILLLIFVLQFTFAQNWNDIYYMESEAEYLLSYNQIDDAIELYKEALEKIPNSANLKFKLAYAFLQSDDKQTEAIKYLEEAVEDISKDYDPMAIKEVKAPIDAWFYLGNAYRIGNQIEKAIDAYSKYKDQLDPEESESKALADQYIKSCRNLQAAMNKPIKVNRTNLGEAFNTKESNKHVVISGDGNRMAYNTYTTKGIDIYVADKESNGNWGPARKKTTQIGKFMRISSISNDGNTLYLIFDDPSNYDVYVSSFAKNKWSKAAKLKKPINTKYHETHASVSEDGNTLYFTSDRKESTGGLDIFKSTKDAKGKWSVPVNLGSSINTAFDEETPFISSANILFFSSEGHDGYGGFDIFYANVDGSSKAQNIGYPLNDNKDNTFYYPENGKKSGYIAYYDQNGKGKKDLYHVMVIPNIKLKGSIAGDLIAENTEPYNVVIKNTITNEEITTLAVNPSNNNFEYELPTGKYTVSVTNSFYNPYSESFNIPEDFSSETYDFTANMEQIQIAEEVVEEPTEEEVAAPVLAMNDVKPVETPVIPTENTEVVEESPVEEIVTETKETEPVVEEPVKKEEVIIEEKEEPEPVIIPEVKEEVPVQEAPVEIINRSYGTSYSVQIAALTQPVDADYFRDIDNVTVTKGKDNYFRYTVGYTETESEANELLAQIQSKGFTDAFVKKNNFSANYTIQFMSLKESLDYRHFDNVYGYSITKTENGWFRYTYGMYEDAEQAKEKLPEIASLGYKEAFIKKVK